MPFSKKMHLQTLFLLIGLFLLIACNPDTQTNEKVINSKNIKYYQANLNLYLDNFTPFGPEIIVSGVSKRNEVIFTNTINSSIDYYDLNNGKLNKRLNIPKENFNGVPDLAGAIELGGDSILIFNKFVLNRAKILDNKKNKVLDNTFFDKWDFYNMNPVNIVCSSLTQPISVGDKLYFLTWPLGKISFNNIDSSIYSEFEYNKSNKELVPLSISYPEIYFKNKYPDYLALPMRTFHTKKNQLVYSWPLLDGLGVFDISTKKFEWVNIKNSSIVAKFISNDRNTKWGDIVESTHYNGILYDIKKDLYYRFYFLPIKDYRGSSENNAFAIYHMPFCIQIINSEFEEIGKIELEGNKYDFARAFVHDGKLYVSKNNLYNIDLEENILKYAVIEISK